jgi:citrate lyase subunit beta/citryl-CoA lyase/(S)-citramalyl-CoA lyase
VAYRSLLFVPGARPERFDKALAAGADVVCIDLEDAVPPDAKEAARATVVAWAAGRGDAGVRLNGLRTAAGIADLAAFIASGARPAFFMMPKVSHPQEIAIALEATGGATPIWPIVENAEGMARAGDIASEKGVAGILFGGADYSADIGASLDWEPMLFARATLVNACARAGCELLDVPYLDVKDEAGLVDSTRRARAMGFTGRACIHPAQVAGVHAAFTPGAAEIERAERVMAAFAEAKGGAALLDGKLVELPVIRAAERTLGAAKRQGH